MKRRWLVIGSFVAALALMASGVRAQNPVTFQCNMSIQILSGTFDPANDTVVVRGSFNGWAGSADRLTDPDADSIYTVVVDIPDDQVGQTQYYKYVILSPGKPDRWESDPNRDFVLLAGGQVLEVQYFDRQTTLAVTANVTFQADMTDMLTKGYFDPATDSIRVVGKFNGWANTESMQPDLFDPSLYVYTTPVTDAPGGVQEWKFRAYPTDKFLDNGWESGSNHAFTFTGEDMTLPPLKPNILPAGRPLTQTVTARFSVNVRGATDWFNKEPFVDVKSVWLNGDFIPLGQGGWGSWAVADTSQLVRLYDDGTHGDETAGDEIWTGEVEFATGTMNTHLYKYGIYAAGVDTLNQGNIPMDNEAGFAVNHFIMIDDTQPLFVNPTDVFGSERPSPEVTFQLDMSIQMLSGLFDPANDKVVVRGSFNGWAGEEDELTDANNDSIFVHTVMLDDSLVDQTIYFKYVILRPGEGDRWEGDPNREHAVTTGHQLVALDFFDRVSQVAVTANVKFQANMSDLLTKGWFDPATDSIRVVGGFNGWANDESMVPDLFDPSLYVWDTDVTAAAGSDMEWKFRAYPTDKWLDNGWEGGSNHVFTFSGDDMVLEPLKPNISPAGHPLAQDVTVRFSVNVDGAVDWFNKQPFVNIQAVFLNGDFVPLGQGGWGSWAVADTGTLVRMYDDGSHGDQSAGDKIWTTEVLFAQGTMSAHLYKYGIYADGVDTLNGGNIPMDNEAGFANNHTVLIDDSQPLYVAPTDIFGSQWRETSVRREDRADVPTTFFVSRNYPNPFNPQTTIRYGVPKQARVILTVYNILGQKVATLVNEEQPAGYYKVRWDARNDLGSQVPTGLYVYRFQAGDYVVTRKMTLMK